MKEYRGSPPLVPQPIIVDGEKEYEIEFILAHRDSRRRREYLCRWKGYDMSSDEWLPLSELTNALDLVREYHERNNLPPVN